MENITKQQYEYALERMEELLPFVHEDTPLDDKNSIELDIVSSIVEDYEQKHYPVDKPTLGSLMREALFALEKHHSKRTRANSRQDRGRSEPLAEWHS